MHDAGFAVLDVQRLIPRLRRYALALTGHRDAADDLTQDTLERAWRKRALWQPGTDLRAWLFSVMHNVWVNGVRGARPTVSLEADDAGAVASEATPASAAEGGIVLAELQRALLQLPDEQRAVLLLVGLEQLSYAETAAALDVPIGTVMSRLARAREHLRQRLGQEPRTQAALRRVK